jgi:tRNA A-37 threonylcarbamoyl transferase component Bud32
MGLPTFEPVALGRLVRSGVVRDSFLVSRGIPEAVPLDEFVTAVVLAPETTATRHDEAGPLAELRQRLAIALGELAARLHLAGIEHADFHAANILVRVGPDGEPRLWLIDLHKVHIGRPQSRNARFNNLSILHQFFAGKSSRTDRLRFYRAYRQHWRAGVPACERGQRGRAPAGERDSEREEITGLEQVIDTAARAGWRRADRAWRRGNRHVRRRDASGVSCRGLAALEIRWLEQVRDDPERLFCEHLITWHKQTRRHRVAEIRLPPGAAAGSVGFLKCIESPRNWRRWLARFRMSPVRRSWELGHALRRRAIDTPRPILFVERQAPEPGRYYLLTEAVPDSVGVGEFFAKLWPGLSATDRRDWLRLHLRRLALQMRLLHDEGFDHRDLKFANLLVARRLADPRVWFLDLEGVRLWDRLPVRRAMQNLARINVSAVVAGLPGNTDRLRFLKWYLGAQFETEWKKWWRRIGQLSQAKISGNRRDGRTLS